MVPDLVNKFAGKGNEGELSDDEVRNAAFNGE
jgi:hypothetical protein